MKGSPDLEIAVSERVSKVINWNSKYWLVRPTGPYNQEFPEPWPSLYTPELEIRRLLPGETLRLGVKTYRHWHLGCPPTKYCFHPITLQWSLSFNKPTPCTKFLLASFSGSLLNMNGEPRITRHLKCESTRKDETHKKTERKQNKCRKRGKFQNTTISIIFILKETEDIPSVKKEQVGKGGRAIQS